MLGAEPLYGSWRAAETFCVPQELPRSRGDGKLAGLHYAVQALASELTFHKGVLGVRPAGFLDGS